MDPERARRRRLLASAAEQAVSVWLVARGFSIVATNLRLGHLELDIVARHQNLVVVVEVRTRGPASFQTAFGSIGWPKLERLRRATRRLWRARYRDDPTVTRIRLDAAAVTFIDGEAHISYRRGLGP